MQMVCGQLASLTGFFSDSLVDLFQFGALVNFPVFPGHWSEEQSTEHAHEFGDMLRKFYVDPQSEVRALPCFHRS